ncbi:hypothetical protein Q5752_000313 [Cryptotrichosporon argae]
MRFTVLLQLVAVAASLAGATASANRTSAYAACQSPRSQGQQLALCPNGTLYVSQTDPEAEYGTIQSAVLALPNDTSSQVILVGPGSYHEVVNVTRPGPLVILGMTANASSHVHNTVSLWNSSYINQTTQTAAQDNADAVVLTVSPSRNASRAASGTLGPAVLPASAGYPFGSVDFKMYNVDVANRATVGGVEWTATDTGPSAALLVAYANASFYHCSFASYQDTLYVGRNGSAVFVGGEVRGSTDYIYGFGTAYFEGTTLASRRCGGATVAWKGSQEWYGPDNYGAYFNNSALIKSPDANATLDLTGQCALGRPWNNNSRVVYANTYMSDIVDPAGFIIWSDSDPRVIPNVTVFVEAGSYGPGFNASARNLSIESIEMRAQAAAQYSLAAVFGGLPSWVDRDLLGL